MGLDILVMKAHKPDLDLSRVYDKQILSDMGYRFFGMDEIDMPMYSDLKEHCVLVKVETECWDVEKIQKHYNLLEKPHWCGCGEDGRRR